jgi:hypothetical protein
MKKVSWAYTIGECLWRGMLLLIVIGVMMLLR